MSGIVPPLDTVRLAAARLRASEIQPFLAVPLYALTPVVAPGLGTFAVDDRWRLFVDPQRLQEWNVPEVAGVLLHEVGHLIRDHAGRATLMGIDAATKLRWNVAADAEINDDLVDDRVVLPRDGVLPATLGLPRHKAAEYYYARLGQMPATIVDCGSGCHGVDDDPPTLDITRTGAGTGDGTRARAHAGAAPRGLSPAEVVLLRRRTADAIVAWGRARRGKGPGNLAGGWERWAEALLHPQIDWRRVLTASIRGSIAAIRGASDYSYARPSRRRIPGIVLPALERPLPTVAVVIDTSASVDDAQLGAAWTEVQGCLRSLGVRRDLLRVYAVDTAVTEIKDLRLRRVPLTGGGGTDMGAGITAALQARPRPTLVVVITDGFTPWPARPRATRVVVGLLEGRGHARFAPHAPPAWATTISIPLADAPDDRNQRSAVR